MKLNEGAYPGHAEATAMVAATPQALFGYLDDPRRLGSHMEQRSWAMAGARMSFELDAAQGRSVGARIRLHGRVLGYPLELDEVAAQHEPARTKTWETVGAPRLLVIGSYRMGFEIAAQGQGSRLRVLIDFAPGTLKPAFLNRWLGQAYGRWCVERMAKDAQARFADMP